MGVKAATAALLMFSTALVNSEFTQFVMTGSQNYTLPDLPYAYDVSHAFPGSGRGDLG